VDFAEQIALGRVAPHAVVARIAPTTGAPDAARGVAAHPGGCALPCEGLRQSGVPPRVTTRQDASHGVRCSTEFCMRPAGEDIGSSLPPRSHRFRWNLRFVPSAVPRALAHTGSSSRKLRASSETPVPIRPAPPGVEHLPWGSPSLFATSADGVVATSSLARHLPSSAFLTPPRV